MINSLDQTPDKATTASTTTGGLAAVIRIGAGFIRFLIWLSRSGRVAYDAVHRVVRVTGPAIGQGQRGPGPVRVE